MPSKIVYLKCNRAFVHGQIRSPQALEMLNQGKRSLGSSFFSSESARQHTGLSDEEVKLLLPLVLNVRPDEMGFRKEVEKFYINIVTKVPYEKGLKLEIGLEYDNNSPITDFKETEDGRKLYNLPIDVDQYIRYRHAIGDPRQNINAHFKAVRSPEEAKGNQTAEFYLEDPELVIKGMTLASDIADKAINVYQEVAVQPDKIKAILTLMSRFVKKQPGEIFIADRLSPEEQKIVVRKLALEKPADFYKHATDKALMNKYILNELIRYNILMRSGTTILVTESKDPLGVNEDAAVDYLFNNPSNSQLLSLFKAQYKENKAKERVPK